VEGTAFYVVYPVVSLKMADDLPGVSAVYQFPQQCVVQTMTRFITDKMTDNRHPQEEKVAEWRRGLCASRIRRESATLPYL